MAPARVVAVDLSISMLEVARINVEIASLMDQILLGHIDAKQLPYESGRFSVVTSNSIIHHIPDPKTVIAELNPNMPRTFGNTYLSMDRIHRATVVDEPIIEYRTHIHMLAEPQLEPDLQVFADGRVCESFPFEGQHIILDFYRYTLFVDTGQFHSNYDSIFSFIYIDRRSPSL